MARPNQAGNWKTSQRERVDHPTLDGSDIRKVSDGMWVFPCQVTTHRIPLLVSMSLSPRPRTFPIRFEAMWWIPPGSRVIVLVEAPPLSRRRIWTREPRKAGNRTAIPAGGPDRGPGYMLSDACCTSSFPGPALIGPIEVVDRLVEDRWHPAAWLHMFGSVPGPWREDSDHSQKLGPCKYVRTGE